MKVRIEFRDPDPGVDRESYCDAVEFTTVYAGTANEWADAVFDFIRESIFPASFIILKAAIEVDKTDLEKSKWFERNRNDIEILRDDLTEMLKLSDLASDSEGNETE